MSNRAARIEQIKGPSQISERLLGQLVDEIPVQRIIDGINEMLSATFTTKAGKAQPDYRAREAGLKLYLAYTVGLPLQRQVVASITPERERSPEPDEWKTVLRSPVARRILTEELQKWETEEQRGGTGHNPAQTW